MKKVFIIIADDHKFRAIYGGLDLCQIIEKLNNDLSACYYNWEIVKSWKL